MDRLLQWFSNGGTCTTGGTWVSFGVIEGHPHFQTLFIYFIYFNLIRDYLIYA